MHLNFTKMSQSSLDGLKACFGKQPKYLYCIAGSDSLLPLS